MVFDFLHHLYKHNIFIYGKILQDHSYLVGQVLQHTREIRLQAPLNKYKFYVLEIKLLGFIVSTKYNRVDSQKIFTIIHKAEQMFL